MGVADLGYSIQNQLQMHSWIAKILTAALLLPASTTPSIAQNRSNVYSCEAFARMSGASLPRSLPCEDSYDNNNYYKSFNLYCEAKSLQDDILALQGCSEKYFKKQKALYGR